MSDTDDPVGTRTMEMHCDSVEFCPVSQSQHIVAVSMYQLEEATRRVGAVQLYAMHESQDAGTKFVDRSKLECSGVFDFKWRPSSDDSRLLGAAALADGSCAIVEVAQDGDAITRRASAAGAGGTGMTVSCDWDPFDHGRLFCSASDGSLSVSCCRDGGAAVESSWQAHDLEAWIVAADRHEEHTVYSGADDCAFKRWDVRAPAAPTLCNRRAHQAGVCCIHSHPSERHLVGTGSYDERARVWDMRQPARPLLEVKVGGGVWRFKWHPHRRDLALLACMHNGFAVVKMTDAGGLDVCHEYAHQKTLGYGADWWWGSGLGAADLVGTCSFYDKQLHFWRPRT